MGNDRGPRNSVWRDRIAPLTDNAARIATKLPFLTANAVTLMGLAGVLSGSVVAALSRPESILGVPRQLIALGLIAAGEAADAVDGAVATMLHATSPQGALLDVMVDRSEEAVMAGARIISAAGRRDPLGVLAATLSGMTSPVPSLVRAMVEARGYSVPESGLNPLSFLGTRPARAVFGALTTCYPIVQNFPVQMPIDFVSMLANIATTVERLKILHRITSGKTDGLKEVTDVDKVIGQMKTKRLFLFSIANALVMTAAGAGGMYASVKA